MTTATALEDPRVRVAMYRSAIYEALSLGFSYPEPVLRERLIVLLEDMLEFEVEVDPEMRDRARELLAALRATDIVNQAVEYNRVFDQSALCSAFETEYEADPFAKARQLADISGFYNAFGMDAAQARPTTNDYIGSELEFMSLLTRNEAYATARHWTRRRDVALDAQRSFLRDHLGRWERTLCGDVDRVLADDNDATAHFYRLLGALCERFVEGELRMFHVKPLRLKQRMTTEREPMSCPLAPDVPEAERGSLSLGDAQALVADED
ncbi:MAG TPA: molecular chaperone TorD family protein [Dehalococcoidia bacterium]|nr:molecular chaperone TorD family protein [Dehalococcoidia bacterium]